MTAKVIVSSPLL